MELASPRRSLVIGTAGHVDHGKSSLVRALTGIDPDRLPEEKLRGMTTDLGFAHTDLGNGFTANFVDVPGHERLVATMVSGAHGFDGALLVVDANEGVRSQTREHVSVLDLLGVRDVVVAITKIDLAEIDALESATTQVKNLLASTGLRTLDTVRVSAWMGEGLECLKSALGQLHVPEHASGVPRLPIDRVFTMTGFGTVVTGTLVGGTLTVGDEIDTSPSGVRGRIRRIQIHGQGVVEALSGERVAVNVSGVSKSQLSRGDVLCPPGALTPVRRFEARVRMLDVAESSIGSGSAFYVHAGTAASIATIYPLESPALHPGEDGWAQFRLEHPIAVWRGQRFIIRTPSPPATVGGGIIADIAPRRRAKADDVERLATLVSNDIEDVVVALLTQRRESAPTLMRTSMLKKEDLSSALTGSLASDRVIRLGSTFAAQHLFNQLSQRLTRRLEAYHADFPLRGFMPAPELQRAMRLDGAAFHDLTMRLLEAHLVAVSSQLPGADRGQAENNGIPVRGFATTKHFDWFSQRQTFPLDTKEDDFVNLLESGGFPPPPVEILMRLCGLESEQIRRLVEARRVVRVADWLYLSASTYGEVVARVENAVSEDGGATVASIRDALGSSRKYVLAIVDHLDSRDVTRRVGNYRIPGEATHANRG